MDVPASQDVVTPLLLERNAGLRPDATMAVFDDGTVWTWSDAARIARRAAAALHANGVRQGDHVAVLLPNGPDFLAAWLGITALGAAIVPINLAFKGAMLAHLVRATRPSCVISAGAWAATITEVAPDLPVLHPGVLATGADGPPRLDRPIEFWDTHHIMLTGGTTGPSKAARCSHLHFHQLGLYGTRDVGLDETDVFLIDLPLFHTAALGMVGGCITTMTPISVRGAPDLRGYWATLKEANATIALVLSSMVGFLMAQPPSAADTDHRLRFLISIPVTADPEAFMARFGIPELVTAYGGTESSTAMSSTRGPIAPRTCGVLRPGYQARLVDDNDIPVPPGRPGELLLRHDLPWALFTEYVGDPDATARAWRNGWFHTGDLFRQSEDGNYFFVDRAKDAIRRRGENVSCFEVEREIVAFPAVGEVACVAAPSPTGIDDELKAWIVPVEGQPVDLDELVRHLVDALPHFMVPRYYELTTALPKNPSMKVQKFVLRDRGHSDATWDAEAHGRVRVTSKGLVELG